MAIESSIEVRDSFGPWLKEDRYILTLEEIKVMFKKAIKSKVGGETGDGHRHV